MELGLAMTLRIVGDVVSMAFARINGLREVTPAEIVCGGASAGFAVVWSTKPPPES
jgi:hypothetical protein